MKWFAVYPGSEKLDLGPKQCVAMFLYEDQAKQFAERYGRFGYIEPIAVIVGDPHRDVDAQREREEAEALAREFGI